MQDKALDTIAHVIGGLVEIMENNRLPAVDFADLKAMFERNEDGCAKVWYVGQGTAKGEGRAVIAAQDAAADIQRRSN